MKNIFFALIALMVLSTACKTTSRQQGNHEKLELFHKQKQVFHSKLAARFQHGNSAKKIQKKDRFLFVKPCSLQAITYRQFRCVPKDSPRKKPFISLIFVKYYNISIIWKSILTRVDIIKEGLIEQVPF